MVVLLFGGTFDPPHRAHVELPCVVAQALDCRRIIFVPAACNPLKLDEQQTADHHRLAMLRLAVRDIADAEIATVELERGSPSYFVDTLDAILDELAEDVTARFLVGADQALQFHRWKDWQRILRTATPVVVLRPPLDLATFHDRLQESYGPQESAQWLSWTLADIPAIDVSATDIRERLARGDDVSALVDPLVLDYIHTHDLYTESHRAQA